MSTAWKWKLGLLAGLTILSIYLLVPSLFGFQATRESIEAQKGKLPWYFDIFPDKGINLGLDLRGGIYLEFEVELSRALENKVDLIASDLMRTFEKKKIFTKSVHQDTTSHSIIITAENPQALFQAEAEIHENYNTVLVKRPSPNDDPQSIAFGLEEVYAKNLEDQISKQALEKVRNRIDRYGVAEPSIQRLGSNRIAVELPGIKDPDRAINLIKKAGQLEFKIVNDTVPSAELTKLIADAREKNTLTADDFSTATAAKLTQVLNEKLPPDTEIAFETQFDPIAKKIKGGVPYVLNRKAELTGEMLKNAQTNVNNNEPYVSLTFDTQGATLFGETTKKNVGKRLAILLDGVINSAPVIREPILGGQAQITLGYGNYKDLLKECEDLVLVLQEGALPAQLTEATKTVVGPSLGTDSIHKGVTSTLVGFAIIALFMIFYYRSSGFLADLALIFNLLFVLAALALFQATLTLPGIAGIVLTIAMGVDANVLILERIREEKRQGKTPKGIIESGYGHAMRTIIDSHVTTFLAGMVLYQFGSGPVKGFAVTLMIGIVISLYTACTCTRMAYDYLLIKKRIESISL